MQKINCTNVTQSYLDTLVLDKVNLSLNEGESLALVGLNGCGKSTLLKSIVDLVAIDTGEITIEGKQHKQVSSRQNIAYLPDKFTPPAYLSANEFIHYMQKISVQARSKQAEIAEMFAQFGLENKVLNLSVNKLSKGMTQKLGLISCLLSKKPILLLDEPMSGLDMTARITLKQKLKTLKQQGTSLLFSTHHLSDVEEIADSMIILHHTKIQFTGSVAAFKKAYKTKSLEQAYLKCIQ